MIEESNDGFIDVSNGMLLVEDGTYNGTISGYRVKFESSGQGYEFETTSNGVRGENTPVRIVVTACNAKVYHMPKE